jgi:hypothetical protein
MTINSDSERLASLLSGQYDDLLRALWKLEQSERMVPTVDEAQWQGPMRWYYDRVLADLRSVLAAASTELRLARRETHAAVQTLRS